jgi:hypothetical protein
MQNYVASGILMHTTINLGGEETVIAIFRVKEEEKKVQQSLQNAVASIVMSKDGHH